MPTATAESHLREDPYELAKLQLYLMRSHAAGVGAPLPDTTVRLILVLKAASLARGFSGDLKGPCRIDRGRHSLAWLCLHRGGESLPHVPAGAIRVEGQGPNWISRDRTG